MFLPQKDIELAYNRRPRAPARCYNQDVEGRNCCLGPAGADVRRRFARFTFPSAEIVPSTTAVL
jgi:hypothetical protein